jgi:REP element-mobilizing transposase RayT
VIAAVPLLQDIKSRFFVGAAPPRFDKVIFHGWIMVTAHIKPHAKDLRRGRFSEPGQYYLVTTVTNNRLPLFKSLSYARAVVQVIRAMDATDQCQTLAWVLMPDHLHWLFVLRSFDLPVLVGQMKQISSREINRLRNKRGQNVWQHGFHDRMLREEDDIVRIARYIVANPLRAGLVDHIGNYSYWDAVWL